ncbi:MAG: hypothetical protein JKY34_09070 [Kordiimonadaceae bacterium]|nr:hypothetical protein [Kordiimonadaceae bacterium]
MINRSEIFKRAWALAKMNKQFANAKITDFGKWLKLAWKELKGGNTEFWATSRPTQTEALATEVHTLQMSNRLGIAGVQRLNALQRKLAA